MTFAIIKTGGKQYKVAAGEKIKIEKLPNVKEGEAVVFDEVLLVDNDGQTKIGTPRVEGSKVKATVTKAGLSKKVTVIHYKAKVRHKKITGHRQPFVEVKIDEIK